MSGVPARIRKWNQFSQIRWIPIKVMPAGKTQTGYTLRMSKGFKSSSSPRYLFLQLIYHIQWATGNASPDVSVGFHARPYSRFMELKSNIEQKKTSINQVSNFLWDCFSSRDDARAPIQFRRETQSQHLKRWFFIEKWPIRFHINTTAVLWMVKWSKLSFSSIETSHFLPQSTGCCRSNSSSEINSRCCHKWGKWGR